MRKIECFKIRILEANNDNVWDIKSQKALHDIVCDHLPLSFNPVTIVADPFLFVYGGKLFLFYEMKRNYSHGVICMTNTEDLTNWSKPVVVLEENFHLSYPFVLEEDGNVYMIPETSEVGDIRLYKADNDKLLHFSFFKTLIHKEINGVEIRYADSSVYIKNGVYYLMSSTEEQGVNTLYLYLSNNLYGPYKEHPCSPVCSDSRYGRNGGCMIEYDGRLYRLSQDCEIRYGDNLHLFEVLELNSSTYKERLIVSALIPHDVAFYREGGHQYNSVRYKGKIIVATDAKEYNSYLVYRCVHKLSQILVRIVGKTIM